MSETNSKTAKAAKGSIESTESKKIPLNRPNKYHAPSPGKTMAEEMRKEANKMTEGQREEAVAAAMRAIYQVKKKKLVSSANRD